MKRQVTCRRKRCQRAQHAEACRRWHRQNRESSANHYQDVVVPFRKRHPGYQRRWRLVRSLGEIRDEIGLAVHGVGKRLSRVLARGRKEQALAESEPAQARATTGKLLCSALAMAAEIQELIAALGRKVAELEGLG